MTDSHRSIHARAVDAGRGGAHQLSTRVERGRAASRADVAKLAGTSPSVVSYTLNGTRPVAAETRARVMRAVEQLNYRPNAVARSLVTSRTHTIGLLVPDCSNPFFAELGAAIEDAAFAATYIVLLGNSGGSRDRELSYMRAFVDRQVDGIIVCPSDAIDHLIVEAERACIPLVTIDRPHRRDAVPAVLVDHLAGARLATEHLLGHGCRVIGCVAGRPHMPVTQGRVEGWRQAIAVGETHPRHDLVRFGDFTADAGYRLARELLAAEPGIDGMFVSSDEQAFGVLRALSDVGRRCPEDVAVVAFDGIDGGSYTTPRLTSVLQPFARISETVVEVLQSMIGRDLDSNDVAGQHRVLPVELLIRESCGCRTLEALTPGSG